MPEQPEQPKSSGVLYISPADFQKMLETGKAQIVPVHKKSVSVEQVVEEFKTYPHTPDRYTRLMESIWKERGETLKKDNKAINITIPPCPYTEEDITHLENEGRRLAYLPKDLSTQETRYLLGILFPTMQSDAIGKGNTVTNEEDRSGWFDYDGGVDASYTNTTEVQLKKEGEKHHRFGMNLNEYIIASQDTKLITNTYLDQKSTWTRLLGSRRRGAGVSSRFSARGNLYVRASLDSEGRYPRLGGRLVGVKK